MPLDPRYDATPTEIAWAAVVDEAFNSDYIPPLIWDVDRTHPSMLLLLAYNFQADLYTDIFDQPNELDPYEFRREAIKWAIPYHLARTTFRALDILTVATRSTYTYTYNKADGTLWTGDTSENIQGINLDISPNITGASSYDYLDYMETRAIAIFPWWLILDSLTFVNSFKEEYYIGQKATAITYNYSQLGLD